MFFYINSGQSNIRLQNKWKNIGEKIEKLVRNPLKTKGLWGLELGCWHCRWNEAHRLKIHILGKVDRTLILHKNNKRKKWRKL